MASAQQRAATAKPQICNAPQLPLHNLYAQTTHQQAQTACAACVHPNVDLYCSQNTWHAFAHNRHQHLLLPSFFAGCYRQSLFAL
jgi:hypothetical protein